jgi:beta-lactamase regulating signal transducer with metallopeptidase domain/protocatechuate 3,4-dioxygenase beta subunit
MNGLECLRDSFAQISAISPWALLLTKITLLLAVAWLMHFSLARANPRWRTLLWRGTVVGLALLAVWTLGLPGLEIRIEAPVATMPPPSRQAISTGQDSAVPVDAALPPVETSARPELAAPAPQTSVAIRPEAARVVEPAASSLSWTALLLGIWGLGMALLAVRLGVAYRKIVGLLQTSQAVPEEILIEARRVAAAIGCRREVHVRSSRHYAVPFLYGSRRPVLVLPERMCQPAYRPQLPGIIAHELAHVRSGDFGWNAALQAVSVWLWFHPLAWRMGAAHRAACDAVCDAISAAYVGDVETYCRTLARVALEGAASFPAAGLAMARTCDVRRRIAVLDRKVFASSLGRRAVVGVALIGLLALALLAGVRLALAEPPKSESNGFGRVVDAQGRGVAGATLTRNKSAWTATTDGDGFFRLPKLKPRETVFLTIAAAGFLTRHGAPFVREAPDGFVMSDTSTFDLLRPATISGRVLGTDGKPLAGAPLSLDAGVHYARPNENGVTGNYRRVLTDRTGQFTMRDVPPGLHVVYYPEAPGCCDESARQRPAPVRGVCGAILVEVHQGQQLTGLTMDLSQSTASVEGRVFGPDGQPLAGVSVHLRYIIELDGIDELRGGKWQFRSSAGVTGNEYPAPITDSQGRYRLTGIAPGRCELGPSNQQFEEGGVLPSIIFAPGQKVHHDIHMRAIAGPESSVAAAQIAPAADANHSQGSVVEGQVVDDKDQPVAGAQVTVIGTSRRPHLSGNFIHDRRPLSEAKTDSQGLFRMALPPISSATYDHVTALASAAGCGLGWQPLALDANRQKARIRLSADQPIRGRVLDKQGRPVANVPVRLCGVSIETAWLGNGVAWPPDWQPGKAPPLPGWPAPALTDSQGRFVFHGVNRRDSASLTIPDPRFAPWRFDIEPVGKKPPGKAEQERDATSRDGEKIYPRDLSEEMTLVPPSPQIIKGWVLYADSGQPAANARLTLYSWNSSRGRHGSWIGISGQADANGHFRLNPYPSKFFDIAAYPATGQPYLILQKPLDWPDGATSQKVDLALPRGILVRGKIIESPSGKPVGGAAVQYHACERNPHLPKGVLTRWQGIVVSDSQGEFQIAVPAGRGTLLIHGPTPDYITQVIGSEELGSGKPQPGGIRNYVHAARHLDLAPNAPAQQVTVSLRRGITVRGRLVDPQGKPVPEALMLSRLVRASSPEWRTSPLTVRGGAFELPGCDPKQSTTVYFLDAEHQQGASVELSGRAAEHPLVVQLQPCGSASVRFVDFEAKPIAGPVPTSLNIVMTPGLGKYYRGLFRNATKGQWLADEDFVANFDRKDYWSPGPVADQDGRCTFPCLVPGASYRLYDNLGHTIHDVAKDFSAKPGERLQLPDLVMERPEAK